MLTVLDKQQKVMEYVNSREEMIRENTDLIFFGYVPREHIKPLAAEGRERKLNLDSAVLRVLTLCEQYPSANSRNEIETIRFRYRSALDIWRHLKYFYPEVSIFEVMETLHRLGKELYGQYCPIVRRRVFKVNSSRSSYLSVTNKYTKDEFGLVFSNWARMENR